MLPAANLGRDRNKVKFNIWGFYLKGEGKGLAHTLKSLKAATSGEKEVLRPLGPSKKQTEISLNVPLSRQTLLYLAGCTLYLAKRAVISPNVCELAEDL